MRRVKRWRYYCDFCGKGGGSAYHIQRHEKGCTMNPNRDCGYCRHAGGYQESMEVLLSILPEPEKSADWADIFLNFDDVEAVMPKLREAAGNCPACIMAALRQKGIPVPAISSFNFKEESDAFWAGINAAQSEAENRFFSFHY